MNLKLKFISHRLADYAVKNWHYSHNIPVGRLVKIGVYEDDSFRGAVIFGDGVLGKTEYIFGIKKILTAELVRIALREHVTPVSRLIKISISMLIKQSPRLKLLISFADSGQNHHGGIYQASNWIYTGITKGGTLYKHKKTGNILHDRLVKVKGGTYIFGRWVKCAKPSDCEIFSRTDKHRYFYPLDKETHQKILKYHVKQTPKRVGSIQGDNRIPSGRGRFESDPDANKNMERVGEPKT